HSQARSRQSAPWRIITRGVPSGDSRGFGEIDVAAELARIQVVVEPAPGEQLIVRTAFDYLTIADREHLVRMADRAQTVRNDERGPAVKELLECPLNQALGARVD